MQFPLTPPSVIPPSGVIVDFAKAFLQHIEKHRSWDGRRLGAKCPKPLRKICLDLKEVEDRIAHELHTDWPAPQFKKAEKCKAGLVTVAQHWSGHFSTPDNQKHAYKEDWEHPNSSPLLSL